MSTRHCSFSRLGSCHFLSTLLHTLELPASAVPIQAAHGEFGYVSFMAIVIHLYYSYHLFTVLPPLRSLKRCCGVVMLRLQLLSESVRCPRNSNLTLSSSPPLCSPMLQWQMAAIAIVSSAPFSRVVTDGILYISTGLLCFRSCLLSHP